MQNLALLETKKEPGGTVRSERGDAIGVEKGTVLLVEATCTVRDLLSMKGRLVEATCMVRDLLSMKGMHLLSMKGMHLHLH